MVTLLWCAWCLQDNVKKWYANKRFTYQHLHKSNWLVGWVEGYDGNNTSHWSGYEAWLEHEIALTEYMIQTNFETIPLLLLLVFFIDDYLRDKTRRKMNLGISFSIANFSTTVCVFFFLSLFFIVSTLFFQVYRKPSSKFCLCTTSADAPYHEVIEQVIVRPCKKLQNADFECDFLPKQTCRTFFGGLLCVIGDDIGARKSLNRLGPTSKMSSRFFEQTAESYCIVVHPNQKIWKNVDVQSSICTLLYDLNVQVTLIIIIF